MDHPKIERRCCLTPCIALWASPRQLDVLCVLLDDRGHSNTIEITQPLQVAGQLGSGSRRRVGMWASAARRGMKLAGATCSGWAISMFE
ncbi:hypothetical protein H257_10001 [Aphanomyces astaci]|uniref:Uncharacterized protein n=1 Tax=Aphanomyces astaci TaxID=112090 RepID=W4G7B7_APHAT|nr:hypothetical protein H257_10001 [Aphanomyces astaci]ETV75582.1 hypothetical protein H257_10001 [Aphanomyces astaci]|eukprot:XP_009834713.1 hypothetical protein H257_10001 [Aphanomyces astaci]